MKMKLFIGRMIGVVKSKALSVSLTIVTVAIVSPVALANSGPSSLLQKGSQPLAEALSDVRTSR